MASAAAGVPTATLSVRPLNPPPPAATISSDSDSVTSGREDSSSRLSSLEDSIFAAYLQLYSRGGAPADLSKIRSFLASAAGRGPFVACLICLERLRPSDPVWSCSGGCYAIFHLPCIQNWARQSSLRPSAATSAAAAAAGWACPKCRLSYDKSRIPRSYFCFCGKLEDPPSDPWILPHSCGEICGRPIAGGCGHDCLLLCHPGPCPPCPKLVASSCFCGACEDVRRCAHKYFSCRRTCNLQLPCGIHRCSEICHDGPCPPCRVLGTYKCQCGKQKEERECHGREFKCEHPCGGMLKCGKHKCDRGCHLGLCGDCPLQGRRTCPCGKREYKGVSCDSDVPNCGSTCEKMLSCKLHMCPERCHRGSCIETCRTVIVKYCRCGSLKKEVPCYQDLICDRKCQRVRDCGQHACKRRCCDGNCPPCPEICGRKLLCNNHKCPSPCHRGTCAPCPLMVVIRCACGETHFEVPCGVEKNQKPPRCPKPCRIPRLCSHKSECKPHRCHYGACPTCKLICREKFSCGHNCKERCHGPKPPPNPEFILKPTKKMLNKRIESLPGSPCPPCQEVAWRSCLGQHVGEERPMVCSKVTSFPCQNLCGNLLACGNHYCTKSCHVLMFVERVVDECERRSNHTDQGTAIPSSKIVRDLSEPCEDCCLPCQKIREPKCTHSCPLRCHPDICPPCKVLVKRSCHCGTLVRVFECIYYNSLSEKEQQNVRSCGGPCHRKLPNCPHLCSEVCHTGQCQSAERCLKKVTVRCACNNIKKEWPCQDAQDAYNNAGRDPKDVPKSRFGFGLLSCTADCANKTKLADSELQLRKTVTTQDKAQDIKHEKKRRKRRERVQEAKEPSKYQAIRSAIRKFVVYLFAIIVITTSIYYGYKGLLSISDWMNEMDKKRMARRFPRA